MEHTNEIHKSKEPTAVSITVSHEGSKQVLTFASNDSADNVKGLIAASLGLPIENVGGLRDGSDLMNYSTSPVVIKHGGSFEVLLIPLPQVSVPMVASSFVPTLNGEKRKKTPKTKRPGSPSSMDIPMFDDSPPAKKSRKDKEVPTQSVPKPKKKEVQLEGPMKECLALLNFLKKHQYAYVFNKPVDTKTVVDYLTIIKTPMDLGTITNHIESGRYRTPEEFAGDVRLTFSNALVYNPPQSDIAIMAQSLSNTFEKKFAAMKQEGKIPASNAPVEGMGTGNSQGPNPASLHQQKVKKEEDTREMTPEEKRSLSQNINALAANHLGDLVQIIHQRMPNLVSSHPDEIEIDLEMLDNATLRYLEKYVKKCLAKQKKKEQKEKPEEKPDSMETATA